MNETKNIIQIKNDTKKNRYSLYSDGVFLGKMNPTQLALFYVVYKIRQANYDNEIKTIYSRALSLDANQLEAIIKEIEAKFQIIFQKDEVDFSTIDFKSLLSQVEKNVYIGRIRSFTPTMLAISLTNRCFCQCAYCYAKEHGKNFTDISHCEIDINTLESIFDYAEFAGIKTISLTGGDPLAYSYFWKILEICKRKNIRVNFSTKKELTDNDIKRFLCYKGQIDYIQISIDSVHENEERAMLDRPRSNKVLKSLKKLAAESDGGISLAVNSVLTKYNIDSILDLTDSLISIKNIKHTLSPYTFNFSTNNPEFFPSEEQYRALQEKINKYHHKDLLSYPISMAQDCSTELRVICRAGINALVINYDGNVYACERFCSDDRFSLGNIYEESLTTIWNGDKIELFSNPDQSLFSKDRCGSCEQFEFCVRERGICYVHSYIINNKNIYAPDSFCKYTDAVKRTRIY